MNTTKTFVIRNVNTGKMVDNGVAGVCFEGEDGKQRAYELADIHNKFYPNDLWKVTEEDI